MKFEVEAFCLKVHSPLSPVKVTCPRALVPVKSASISLPEVVAVKSVVTCVRLLKVAVDEALMEPATLRLPETFRVA